MTIYSWSKLYNTPASSLVEPRAMGPFQEMAHDCIESLSEFAAIERAAKPFERIQFLKADPTETEPWRGIMQRNTPGGGRRARVPRPRHGRHDGEAGYHQAFRRGAVQARDARALCPAQWREPHLRRQGQRRPGARLDARPLSRSARTFGLRTLAGGADCVLR